MTKKDKGYFPVLMVLIFLSFLTFIISFYQSLALADIIHLKNGSKMQGVIQRWDDSRIYLKIRMGVVGVNRDEIERIEWIDYPIKKKVEKNEESQPESSPSVEPESQEGLK